MALMSPALLALALGVMPLANGGAQIADTEAVLGGAPVEHNAMALAGSRARHESRALVLVLDTGKTLRLSDDKCAPDDQPCPIYRLSAFLPSHGVFVVWKGYFEGYDFVLVEMANGAQHIIDGPPHYSPDGARFATCRFDEMNGGGTTIWRVASGRYAKEWHDDRLSACGHWKGNDSVAVDVYDDGRPHPMTLVHKGGAWQLHGAKRHS